MVLDFTLVSMFIGQNNSGKSNILDAIEFALGGDLDNPKIYYAKADIEMILEFSDDEEKRHQLPGKIGHFIFKSGQRKIVFGTKEIPYNKALSIILSSRLKRLDQMSFFDLKQIEIDWHNLHKYPSNLENFRSHLKHHFPKISASQNALDINYEHDGLYEGDRRVTIDRLGSGFLRIFAILLYVFHPEYSVVMIDEPEIHLHPAMIDKLNWAMQNASAGQIMFTTHAPLFINPATLGQLFRVVQEENSSKVYSLARAHYNYQRLVQELNADNLEMFFADEVLLVEGVSDRLLMRGLIDKFYKGDRDIKVIQTHGKGNMNLYIDVLKSFNIHFLLMLDKDALKNNYVYELARHLSIHLPPASTEQIIQKLKELNIFILPNGDLEANYPRKYQNEDSKSLNALRAASLISEADYSSNSMANLREIIENL